MGVAGSKYRHLESGAEKVISAAGIFVQLGHTPQLANFWLYR